VSLSNVLASDEAVCAQLREMLPDLGCQPGDSSDRVGITFRTITRPINIHNKAEYTDNKH
jgi:hypothetical protein